MTASAARFYRQASEVDFTIGELPRFPLPNAVLLVEPTFYEVAYVINPHMEGRVGSVDSAAAQSQWSALVEIYRSLGLEVYLVEGRPGFPDMVFCANQTLPSLDPASNRSIIASRMATSERTGEVAYFERFFAKHGYRIHPAPEGPFEGMGDACWHYDRRLLWIGTGPRSSLEAAEEVCRVLDVRAVGLNLVDPLFYHLDTCLSILDADTALWVPSAFNAEGRTILERLIPRLIAVPHDEAVSSLACNAHCPDGHHVVIQSGCHNTVRPIRSHGFEVIECETREFLKAGGSVFCMKQMFWTTPDQN